MDRRSWLAVAGWGSIGAGTPAIWRHILAPNLATPAVAAPQPWNSPGPLVAYPEKVPLIVLTDRPVQLETPRSVFTSRVTPNAAFYVRWHLDLHPNAVDLATWRLRVEGLVDRPLVLSYDDLVSRFPATTVTAVNQCSGNSRSVFDPRVPGGQWGNGAMGCALWTGVRLRHLLEAAGLAGGPGGGVELQFEGLDRGRGPEGRGLRRFLKSLRLDDPVLDDALVAYSMNGAQLPMLNGFPVRLVVPGYFATYWMKSLTWIRVLPQADDNFWMKSAYRIPDTPRANTTPDDVRAGRVATVPIGRMPVRSFIITPDGTHKLPAGLPTVVRGVAFSGFGAATRVEVSADDGRSWQDAQLDGNDEPFAFRAWRYPWTPRRVGEAILAVRATDARGNVQPDDPVWNPGGYMWNRIERQRVTVGPAA